jgi:hypothetical protein
MLEQAHLPGSRLRGQADGVLGAGVAEVGHRGQFLDRVLRVVDQQVNARGQGDRRRVKFPKPGRAGSERKRMVIRKVGNADSRRPDTGGVPQK